MVRDYTKHLKRAMGEQETGSRAISRAMENIMGLVQSVLESTSVLAAESSAIVKSMDVIKQGSRESNFGVADLNQMANTLSHESTLLKQELDRFTLPAPNRGGTLTTATVLWQRLTFDPAYTTASALGFVSKAIHAMLVRYGEGAELIPDLAERWEVLEQGHLYRFHLRHNVKFHNGRPFEAKDVYETFLRLLLPETKSSGAWILRNVRGAVEVLEGRTRQLSGDRRPRSVHGRHPADGTAGVLPLADDHASNAGSFRPRRRAIRNSSACAAPARDRSASTRRSRGSASS